MNLQALKLRNSSIEINADAVPELEKVMHADNICKGSLLDRTPVGALDLEQINWVLKHFNPAELNQVGDKLVALTRCYLTATERHNLL